MDFQSLLPIGSVVLLQGAEKKLMIFGIVQHDPETDSDYDYIGVPYPEGNMGEGSVFLFQHADIAQVVFLGMNDAERDAFLSELQRRFDEAQNI